MSGKVFETSLQSRAFMFVAECRCAQETGHARISIGGSNSNPTFVGMLMLMWPSTLPPLRSPGHLFIPIGSPRGNDTRDPLYMGQKPGLSPCNNLQIDHIMPTCSTSAMSGSLDVWVVVGSKKRKRRKGNPWMRGIFRLFQLDGSRQLIAVGMLIGSSE